MADSNLSYIYTVGAYATLFGAGYAIYQISTQKGKKKAVQPKSTKPSQPEPRKEDRKKKQRMESFTSDNQDSTGRSQKSRPKLAESTGSKSYAEIAKSDNVPDDDVDNQEFAKQFAKAREGTKIANKTENGKQREKSVKQSRAVQIEGAEKAKVSPPSRIPEPETVDEPSSAESTEPTATDTAGVSDMLEPAPAAPSILRLTSTGDSSKQKKKPAKEPQAVETKKQRQNRKKAEAAKAAREESEKERRTLEEKQRRAARIADGRPAKDGSEFMAVNGNKSAWKQGAPSAPNGADTAALYAPLDTFEKPTQPEVKKPSTEARAEKKWTSSMPSEEEQMNMLKDDADEWSTVKTKGAKKSSKKDSSDGNDEPVAPRPAAQPKQNVGQGGKGKDVASKSFGSFSALTSKDDQVEDAEEEWDV